MSEFDSNYYNKKYLKYKLKYLELVGSGFNNTFWQGQLGDDPNLNIWYDIPLKNFNKSTYKLILDGRLTEITINNRIYNHLRKIRFIEKNNDATQTWQETSDEGTYKWIECSLARNIEINNKTFLNQLIPEVSTAAHPLYYIKNSWYNSSNKFRKFSIIPETEMYN